MPRPDAIVIGAGVGGAALACRLAQYLGSNGRVLLVERAAWPRFKVCGCCLNGAALALLEQLGVSRVLLNNLGERLSRVTLRYGHQEACWPVPGGLAIPRATLDGLLVEKAISAGVVFRPGCSATVLPDEAEDACDLGVRPKTRFRVLLRTSSESVECSPRVIIVADGLSGCALDALPEFRPRVQPNSWIGLGGISEGDPAVPSGTIGLYVGTHGYVGLVRLSDGTINLAAAIDPSWVRQSGGPEPAVRSILSDCGMRLSDNSEQTWKFKGTPLLTRRRSRVAAPGLLVIGDAAGYIEPFTGEGMTWALASAVAAADLCATALLGRNSEIDEDLARSWSRWHDSAILGRQRMSRMARALVHRPVLARAAITILRAAPWREAIAAELARRLSAPYPSPRRLVESSPLPGAAA